MREVASTELDPALFRPDLPNHPACSAMLLGNAPGRALVSSAGEALLHSNFQFSFLSDGASQEFVNAAVQRIRADHEVALVWPDGLELSPPPTAGQRIHRLEYRRCEPTTGLLADGYTLRRMDAELVERCLWRGLTKNALGSIENFIEVGIGWCAMHGETIASEAYAVFRGEKTFEIGAITARAHRGRGLAVAACRRLIEECRESGMDVYWSCHESNLASQRAAVKLGFKDRFPYRFYVY
ncbi:MAG: GNAT family N-acetyltransferase [Planctomycetota bacterium]